jgi:sulfoxide reductase heme-binding subunit YedZ
MSAGRVTNVYRAAWWSLFALLGLPFADLVLRAATGRLGLNPLEALLHRTGRWALIALLLSLAITPLRRALAAAARVCHTRWGKRISDWNWIVRLRRMIGLYSFFYACVHAGVYLQFDLGWDWSSVLAEIREKRYLLAGACALALLAPLAATSTDRMMRSMGRNWGRLHRLSYLAAVLALVHFWWLVKVGEQRPLPYTLAAILLLGYRLLAGYGLMLPRPADDGMQVPERGAAPRNESRPATPLPAGAAADR